MNTARLRTRSGVGSSISIRCCQRSRGIEKKARSAVINVTASLKQLRQGLNAFKAQMRGFNRLVSQRQLSDLRVFKIEPRDEAHLVEAIEILLDKSAQVETGRASICLISKACWMMCDWIAPNRPCLMRAMPGKGLRVADLFRLEFVIGKQDQQEESFTEIDSAASNGTVLMAKLW